MDPSPLKTALPGPVTSAPPANRMRAGLWLLLGALLAQGCSSGTPARTCVDVADAATRWNELAAEKQSRSSAAHITRTILESCTEKKWSKEAKDCAVEALGEVDAFERMLACSQDVHLDMSALTSPREKLRGAKGYVKKMSDNAKEYYKDSGVSGREATANGTPTLRHLPESIGPTPPLGTCCEQGGTCNPDPSLWEAKTWRDLGFEVTAPHNFSYEFKKTRDGKRVSYVALAYADLNCDGVYSTLSLYGKGSGKKIEDGGVVLLNQPFE